ncbi:MAG: FkbM family methyltransferase [Pseudonocardiaceae bacterium]
MDEQLKTLVRTGLTYLPGCSDAKYILQRVVRRALKRPFEPEFEALRHLSLRDGRVLVDVGANRGQSIDAMRLAGAGREIVSFEPNPWLVSRLRREYGSDEGVTIHELALSDREQTFTLFLPFYRGYMFDGAASLSKEEAEQWLVGRIYRFDPSLLTLKEFTVRAVRMDSLKLSPSFVKIDVQGVELDVIRGATETLTRYRPTLFIEAPSVELVKFLQPFGYFAAHWIKSSFKRGFANWGNTFFLTEERWGSVVPASVVIG